MEPTTTLPAWDRHFPPEPPLGEAAWPLVRSALAQGRFIHCRLHGQSHHTNDPLAPGLPLPLRRLAERDALLLGLALALRGESDRSVATLYAWFRTQEHCLAATVVPGGVLVDCDQPPAPLPPQARVDLLRELLAGFPCDVPGSEALTIAACRMLAQLGQAQAALALMTERHPTPSGYFAESALMTLRRHAAGDHIPEHLHRFVGDDADYLRQRFCALPFTDMIVTHTGQVKTCCGAHMERGIGRLDNASPEALWYGQQAVDLRRTVLDGSFRHCHLVKCPFFTRGNLPLQSAFPERFAALLAPDGGGLGPERIVYGLDHSCNLSCLSCRDRRYIQSGEELRRTLATIDRQILPLLGNTKKLLLNTSGEVFASKPSLHILRHITPASHPKLRIDLISNGTLFSERNWRSIANVHGMVDIVRVSTDAASKQTFETLRRGGRWDAFQRNLRFLGQLRQNGDIGRLTLSFTYQLLNYREMEAFLHWGRELGADLLIFEKLEQFRWAFCPPWPRERYLEQAVHLPGHPEHEQFLRIVTQPLFAAPGIGGDLQAVARSA